MLCFKKYRMFALIQLLERPIPALLLALQRSGRQFLRKMVNIGQNRPIIAKTAKIGQKWPKGQNWPNLYKTAETGQK